MAPSNPYFYFSSPTVVLPPQQPPHTFANDVATPASNFNFGSSFAQSSSSSRATKFALQLTTPLLNKSSRKRTRDEMTSPVEQDDDFGSLNNTISSSPIIIPTHAEHVVSQNSSFTTDASQPTTSWDRDTVTSKPSTPASLIGPTPPKLVSRKSQRLDSSSAPLEPNFPSVTEGSPPKSTPAEPAIDDFTLLLGVGWTRLSEDEHIQAAARGWTRYIANHFPISGPAILLQSKGLNSFLVGANEGFFLFHEDLNQGQLVGMTWESTLKNLRVTPVAFESAEVLRPAASPIAGGAVSNGAEPQAAMKDEVMSTTTDNPAGQEFSMDLD